MEGQLFWKFRHPPRGMSKFVRALRRLWRRVFFQDEMEFPDD
jgi:hypothetical protein